MYVECNSLLGRYNTLLFLTKGKDADGILKKKCYAKDRGAVKHGYAIRLRDETVGGEMIVTNRRRSYNTVF
jgi:hypothetical protein